VSGPSSAGWWAMLITMLADITAFASLVFGYFFYWTLRQEFPPGSITGPGPFWPTVGLVLMLAAWGLTWITQRWNRQDRAGAFYVGLSCGALAAVAGSCALVAGPFVTQMDPTEHVYSATVWLLVIWTALHAVLGVVMQVYCVARRAAGRLTGKYDIDIRNVVLYWHFVAITVLVTVVVIAGFPLLR
jgi:heme/copper-type cytochrome/quinol oxidase subunit 3